MEKTITLTYDEYQILQNQSKLFEQIRDNDQICICLDHSTKRSFTIKGYDEILKELSDTVNENGTKLERLTWDNAQIKIHVKNLHEDHQLKIRKWATSYTELRDQKEGQEKKNKEKTKKLVVWSFIGGIVVNWLLLQLKYLLN